jgi:hypothetical protein
MQEVADAGGCASISRTGPRNRAAPPSLTRLRPRVFNILFPASISQTRRGRDLAMDQNPRPLWVISILSQRKS